MPAKFSQIHGMNRLQSIVAVIVSYRGARTCFSAAYILHYFVAEMDELEEQFLEAIMKIRMSSKDSRHWKHFQVIRMDAATDVTMEDRIEKI